MTTVQENAPRGAAPPVELTWIHGTAQPPCSDPPVVTLSDSGRFVVTAVASSRLSHLIGRRIDVTSASRSIEQLLEVLDDRLTRAGIVYWIAGETLLACIRDGGILPWATSAEVVAWNVGPERIDAIEGISGRPEFEVVPIGETPAAETGSPTVRITCADSGQASAHRLDENEIFPLRRRKLGDIEVNVPSRSAAMLVRQFGEDGSQVGLVACACQARRGEHLLTVRAEPPRTLVDETAETRMTTAPGEAATPRIERKSVDAFFAARAAKIGSVGPTSAVIYQDKNPEIARRRDAAERALLLPKIAVQPGVRVLDVGCGTGRWTADLVEAGATYHGIDGCEGFIQHARMLHADRTSARFSVCPAERLELSAIGETEGFDRILCFGVLIYLNDEEVARTLRAMTGAARAHARIVMREPVGIGSRLTIRDHFSSDMDQMYNAIYRTEAELLNAIEANLAPEGFRLVESGDVFADASLNNRAETRQRWLLLER